MSPKKGTKKAGRSAYLLLVSSRERLAEGRALRKSNKKYFDLLGLPTEIIVQILRELPPLPPQSPYCINNLHDVHPCLALCSVSSFLKDCYLLYIGKLPTKIEVTIRPDDYLVKGGYIEMQKKLNQRLSILGAEGLSKITTIRIIGPDLDLTTKDDRLNAQIKKARGPLTVKRITPQHKVLLKQHVEQEITRKTGTINDLFSCLDALCNSIHFDELVLRPSELPASAWIGVVRDFILKHPSVKSFHFLCENDRIVQNKLHGLCAIPPYIDILRKSGWLHAADEQAHNYPKTSARHNYDWYRLQDTVHDYRQSKDRLSQLNLEGKIDIGKDK